MSHAGLGFDDGVGIRWRNESVAGELDEKVLQACRVHWSFSAKDIASGSDDLAAMTCGNSAERTSEKEVSVT
jgi:hypothetical protein